MAFTIEFLYENGEPVRALDNEVLDEAKIRSIMNSHPGDIIPLGSGGEKKNYQVIKINHQIRSREISDSGEDEAYHEFIVKAVSDKE